MPILDLKKLNSHRVRTFRLPPSPRVASPKAALEYINARGFIYFWPIKGIDLPSLWTAVAGNRVVADKHDDPGHITWGWKDNALGKKLWYYAKILRSRLMELYFNSVGAAKEGDAAKLFGWRKELITRTINGLVEKHKLVSTAHPKEKGEWFSLPGLS